METQVISELNVKKHSDIEFEAGALASRHGISVIRAREILLSCGNDIDCIDDRAREAKADQ